MRCMLYRSTSPGVEPKPTVARSPSSGLASPAPITGMLRTSCNEAILFWGIST